MRSRRKRQGRPGNPGRRWLQAWPGGALIGVANGIARETTYGKRLDEGVARQISVATAIAALGAYFALLERLWPLRSRGQAVRVGAAWLVLSVAFEFGFGRIVAKDSWEELLAAYDVRAGQTWPLVVLWLGAGPVLARELDRD